MPLVVLGRLQLLEEALVPHEAADSGQDLHVLALSTGRRQQNHEDAHRVGIGRPEGDGLSGERHADHRLGQARHGSVWDRQAGPHDRRVLLLALEQLLRDHILGCDSRRVRLRGYLSHHTVHVARLEARDDECGVEVLAQAHDSVGEGRRDGGER